jgi:hypothetical protein
MISFYKPFTDNFVGLILSTLSSVSATKLRSISSQDEQDQERESLMYDALKIDGRSFCAAFTLKHCLSDGCEDSSSVNGGAGSCADDRKKRPRTAFTAAQIKALESEFEKNKYLSVSKRMQLSKQLKLTETQARTKFATCRTLQIFLTIFIFADQDLVSEPAHKVEEKVHQ